MQEPQKVYYWSKSYRDSVINKIKIQNSSKMGSKAGKELNIYLGMQQQNQVNPKIIKQYKKEAKAYKEVKHQYSYKTVQEVETYNKMFNLKISLAEQKQRLLRLLARVNENIHKYKTQLQTFGEDMDEEQQNLQQHLRKRLRFQEKMHSQLQFQYAQAEKQGKMISEEKLKEIKEKHKHIIDALNYDINKSLNKKLSSSFQAINREKRQKIERADLPIGPCHYQPNLDYLLQSIPFHKFSQEDTQRQFKPLQLSYRYSDKKLDQGFVSVDEQDTEAATKKEKLLSKTIMDSFEGKSNSSSLHVSLKTSSSVNELDTKITESQKHLEIPQYNTYSQIIKQRHEETRKKINQRSLSTELPKIKSIKRKNALKLPFRPQFISRLVKNFLNQKGLSEQTTLGKNSYKFENYTDRKPLYQADKFPSPFEYFPKIDFAVKKAMKRRIYFQLLTSIDIYSCLFISCIINFLAQYIYELLTASYLNSQCISL